MTNNFRFRSFNVNWLSSIISICFLLLLTPGGSSHSLHTINKNEFLKFSIEPAYIGSWSAPVSEVTVRTEPEKWHFVFTKGKADFGVTINADKKASGHIGLAKFENAKIEKNRGLPSGWTGIIYIIDCGKIGKIFESDPLNEKVVEVWICPIKPDGTMEAELQIGRAHV